MRNRTRAAAPLLAGLTMLGILSQGQAAPSASAASSPSFVPVAAAGALVNAGGPAVTGADGRTWSADAGFVGGAAASTTATIAGTADQSLYQSERWGLGGYRLELPSGTYRVKLHMAEITFSGKGERVFSVAAEGQA